MANNPTIVSAALDDKALRESIDKLVQHVEQGTQRMAQSMDASVEQMKRKLAELGNTKIDFGGTADGGATRRTRSQQAETQAVRETAMSYDQLAKAQQVAIRSAGGGFRNADTLQMMQTNLDLLREKLREARQQYSSFIALAAQATTTGDKGLYQFATAGVHQYEQDVKNLIPQIRTLQISMQQMGDVIAPQGHTIQNYVNSLAKANPELAALNEQYKRGVSLMQEHTHSQQQQTNELDKQLQKIKEINSSKSAKAAYESVSSLPTDTIDQANAKLQALQALKEKVANTPLLSKTSQSQLTQAITDTKVKIEQLETSVRGSNQSKRSLDELNAAVRQSVADEQKRRDAILQTGVAAQETFAKIRQSTHIQLADNTDKPIIGIKELTSAIQDMERAYWGMESYNRESPLGQSLKRDIENAQKLRVAIDAFNKSMSGMTVVHGSNDVDRTLGSYTELSNILKTLTNEYRRLGREERDAAKGNDMADKIQRLGRETQKIQQQMNRPINLDAALKGSEKTLDDIAYKMQRLSSFRSGLNVDTQKAEISTVNQEYDRLKKKMDEVMQKNSSMITSNNALGRSWNYMKSRLAFYFTVGASTQFIKNLIEVRSQYEMNEKALGILINSAERGTQIFNELSQMALVSPYTLIELSSAAKQLVAYDVAAKDVVDTTRRLADMASAVGVPMERLTYALGQIKAYGYLNSRDARMFANAGIPLVKQLADYYTELDGKIVSTADVYDRMKKKAIDYNDVMAVVNKMTDEGGKFFDFQAKMADTLKVRLANLTLAWNNMLNDMGKESQGVLSWGIGALRDMFLHWKQLDAAIKDAAWVLGLRTGFMLIAFAALKAGNALGVTSKQMALSSVVGTRLAGVLSTIGRSLATIVKSPITWWSLLALAAWDIFDAFANANKATEDFNKSLRDSAKTTYEDLKKFAEQYKDIRDSLYKAETVKDANGKESTVITPQSINENEAKKAWEAVREQIELSSHASDDYISRLLSIQDVSERLRQGFEILDDVQAVTAALKELGDDGIKVTQGWAAWWNAWQGADGLIVNIKDLQKELQRLRDTGIDPDDKISAAIDKDYGTALERFRKDLKVTTDSVLDFINLQGWDGDTGKIEETFKQITEKLVTQGQLDPQTAFTLQKDVEIARSKAMKSALEIRIADEKAALETATDDISKERIRKDLETLEQEKRNFDLFNGENRAYWNDFTKYIKERHISELAAAYNKMTDNGKKAMDYQSTEWQDYVRKWANNYEKSHNLATDSVFNRLKNWINDANTWSVFIKMTISTEDGKSVYKQLEEYDKAADDAWKTMQRLDKRISQLRKKGAKELEEYNDLIDGMVDVSSASADDKELANALKERAQAQKDYNDAISKGGESKKENSAASKAQKQAESELQKALKEELQLIEKVRSAYKDLTKVGASRPVAIEKATTGFDESVAAINKTLAKFGVAKLDLKDFAGISNPRELVNKLQEQLDRLLKSGAAKPAEIQALQVEIQKITLDAEKYDLTMITKGLNNELDKLKEEYELAVELDANPELGDMFADMMGINVETLPHTIKEYADLATMYLNKYLSGKNANIELPSLDLTNDDLDEFKRMVDEEKLSEEVYEMIKKNVLAIRDLRKKDYEETGREWNSLVEKYGDLQSKILKINKDAAQQQKNIIRQFGDDEQYKKAIELVNQISISQDPSEVARLQAELAKLLKDVMDKNPQSIKIAVAISNEQSSLTSKAYWDDFKKSDMYTTTFEDMQNVSTRAIRAIVARLNELKDKVKEDPASMKSLIKSLEDAEKELGARNPLKAFFDSLGNIEKATKKVETARRELATADNTLKDAENALNAALKSGDPTNITTATEAYNSALDNQREKQQNVTKQESALKKEQSKLQTSLSDTKEKINAISSAFSAVSDVFREFGDEDTADTIDTINEGFAAMETVIAAVIAAMIALNTVAPELLVIAAAMGLIIGLIKLISSSINNKITKQVEESERAVKRLQVAYVDLEHAIDSAYGMATIGAQKAAVANKELQLAELKRQLTLEESRKSKKRDEDKIIDLQKQIKELEYDIKDATDNIINDLLGISSVGDAMDSLMDGFIEALRSGEDAMAVFDESIDDMIVNMVKKMFTTKILQPWFEEQWNTIQEDINSRGADLAERIEKLQAHKLGMEVDDHYGFTDESTGQIKWGKEGLHLIEARISELQDEFSKATAVTTDDIRRYADILRTGQPIMEGSMEEIRNLLLELDTMKTTSDSGLSQLQQGIQGITEDTASALEGYMNGVSQQVYLQSDLLTQIRDAVVMFNTDIQVATIGQILLQLQSSYQTQQAIHSILEGWSSANGMSVRVEMI